MVSTDNNWYSGLVSEYRKPNTTCSVCQKKVYRRPGDLAQKIRGVFCGHVCYGKSQRIEHPCFICQRPILASANKKTCSRSCANKNRAGITYTGRRLKDKVQTSLYLRSRLYEVRKKECQRCGYKLHQILQIHHKDRNPANNELDNLELLCPNCHAKEHYLKKLKV